ncbi:MAG: MoxR family ATPase, partial [Flavobacteriia bacterium]|nr:MoxR family ATPase [Flavobacteriia bacterium]
AKVVIGQDDVVRLVLTAVFCQGHSLLVGVPGLAKTLLVQTIANALDMQFKRIQFTPDLMPSDIVGAETMDKDRNFHFVKGPVFANIILADEINRTPPKTQAALLESMQENAVTISGTRYDLPKPFFVLATQNPIEQEGTYPLPEAQVDRFMLKVSMGYPSKQEEQLILRSNVRAEGLATVSPCIHPDDIIKGKHLARSIYLDEKIERYIVDIVAASRNPEIAGLGQLTKYISYGGSPRATINLALAAKAHAFLERRAFVIPEDVRAISMDVLRHRIGLTYEAEADGVTAEKVIEQLIQRVEVP